MRVQIATLVAILASIFGSNTNALAQSVELFHLQRGNLLRILLSYDTEKTGPTPLYITQNLNVTGDGVQCAGGFFKKGLEIRSGQIVGDWCKITPDTATIDIELHTNLGPQRLILGDDLSGRKAGTYKIAEFVQKAEYKKTKAKSSTITTGNHHCSRNCQGEPTRQSYSIKLNADPGHILRNPKLSCIGHTCVFSSRGKILGSGTNEVVAAVDVWSRPMTWVLSADQFRLVRTELDERKVIQAGRELTHGKSFVVKQRSNGLIRVEGFLEEVGEVVFKPEDPPRAFFEVLRSVETPEGQEITIRVQRRFNQIY